MVTECVAWSLPLGSGVIGGKFVEDNVELLLLLVWTGGICSHSLYHRRSKPWNSGPNWEAGKRNNDWTMRPPDLDVVLGWSWYCGSNRKEELSFFFDVAVDSAKDTFNCTIANTSARNKNALRRLFQSWVRIRLPFWIIFLRLILVGDNDSWRSAALSWWRHVGKCHCGALRAYRSRVPRD